MTYTPLKISHCSRRFGVARIDPESLRMPKGLLEHASNVEHGWIRPGVTFDPSNRLWITARRYRSSTWNPVAWCCCGDTWSEEIKLFFDRGMHYGVDTVFFDGRHMHAAVDHYDHHRNYRQYRVETTRLNQYPLPPPPALETVAFASPATDVDMTWTDPQPPAKNHVWYYAGIHAEDNELAGSSPIWFVENLVAKEKPANQLRGKTPRLHHEPTVLEDGGHVIIKTNGPLITHVSLIDMQGRIIVSREIEGAMTISVLWNKKRSMNYLLLYGYRGSG